MWINKPAPVLLAGLWLLTLAATAQTTDTTRLGRGPFAVVLTVGSGVSYYSTQLGVPANLERVAISRYGLPNTFRAMWFPDHRLRIGLETGRMVMYAYRGFISSDRARVRVSSVPVLLVFSMPLAWLSGTERTLARRLSLSGGIGAYLVHSRLRYAGLVDENRASIGWMAGGAYNQPVSRHLRFGAEFKWYDATATQDAAFLLQLQVVWRAFSW